MQKCENDGYYHNNCGDNEQCKNCYILKEKQFMIDIISTSVIDLDIDGDVVDDKEIIGCIADYAMGYIVKCCNRPNCNNQMIIDNKWQLINNIDHKNQRIYYYKYEKPPVPDA